MTKYYVLVKNRNSSSWKGAIPVRKGVNRKDAYLKARRKIRKNYRIRIITKSQLYKYIKQLKR